MTPEEANALLELFAVCHTVFEEDPFSSATAMAMSLRRIQKPTSKARAVFSASAVIGRGDGPEAA